MISPRYAIGRLIAERMEQIGISRQDLAGRLGYTNMTKGLRKVDGVLRGEDQDEAILERIGMALGIDPEELREAVASAREQQVRHAIETIMPKMKR